MESTGAPWRAVQLHRRGPTPQARSTESTGAVHGIHGRSMESTGAGRGVHFGASGGGVSRNRRRFCGGFRSGRRFRRRRLPKQAALLRRLPQQPALPAAASPETGGASAAASAAASASGGGVSRNRRRLDGGFRSGRCLGGGVSRNRRRFCGGFRSGRRFRQRRLRKQAVSRWRLPQRPAPPAAAPPKTGGVSTAAPEAAGASGGGGSRNRRRFCGGFRSGRRFRQRRLPQRAPARCARAVCSVCSVCSVCLHPTPGARIHALCMYRPRPCTDRTPGLSPLSGTRPALDPGEHREIPNPRIQSAIPATPCKRRSDAKRAPAPPIAL